MKRSTQGARRAATVLAVLLAGACADPIAPAARAPGAPRSDLVPVDAPPAPADEYVVIYKDGATGLADAASAGGAVALGKLAVLNGAVYQGVTDAAALAADPNVEHVSENFRSELSQDPADFGPYPTSALQYRRNWQWNMKQVRADQVPNSVRGQNVNVCIIDSGIDETHQDLAGKVVARESFIGPKWGGQAPSEAPLDSNGHGSHVASTVTSNGIGVAAVAPRARLLNAKVANATGQGIPIASILDAIAWCTEQNADVINMSLGGVVTRSANPASSYQLARAAYEQQIAQAHAAGVVVVVAAGNDSRPIDDRQSYEVWPAQLANTVTVGATAPVSGVNFPWTPAPPPAALFDQKPNYSNYGPDVDVWAPGGAGFINFIQAQITAACSSFRPGCEGGRLYRGINGTSMASPHVAGLAALVTSRATTPKSAARADAIVACMTATGDAVTITATAAAGLPAPTPIAGTYTTTRPRANALRAATEPCAGV